MRNLSRLAAVGLILCASNLLAVEPEKIKEWKEHEARIVTNTPANVDATKPTLLIVYLLPNGSTIEMTAGARLLPGMDWHYDIQHINAQTRKLRQIDPARNYIVAYV